VGRLLVVARLAVRDVRRRPAQAVLLLLAITAATATLTMGIALRGVTSQPYQRTRALTGGPDLMAMVEPLKGPPADVRALRALSRASGVVAHSDVFPVTWTVLRTGRQTAQAMVEGRDPVPGRIDRPKLTAGSWVHPGSAVVERSFAQALDLSTGDRITMHGRSFDVAGIAVSAAIPAYPQVCAFSCMPSRQLSNYVPGLIWLTKSDASGLASQAEALSYIMNYKIADPADARSLAAAHNSPSLTAPYIMSWQVIRDQDAQFAENDRRALLAGSLVLAVLAMASVIVLAAGRMAEQTRRVGQLKAVGATPGLVTTVLLAEHLVLALLAGAAGLVIGWLTAPLLVHAGAGLLAAPGAPTMTPSAVGLVIATAAGVVVAATLIPAVRAARTSTARALADTARRPRRSGWLIAVSARLPASLLMGLRLAGRRPRRVVLQMFSTAVTVSGIVAVLVIHAVNHLQRGGSSPLANPETRSLNQVTLILTIMLVILAAVNAILTTWATVLDARRSSAVVRAIGATPGQISAGLSVAQLLPVLAGALLGIPGGIGLYTVAKNGGPTVIPATWWLVAAVIGTLVALAGLTAIPARIGARRPVTEVLGLDSD